MSLNIKRIFIVFGALLMTQISIAQHTVVTNIVGNGTTPVIEGPGLESGLNGVGAFAIKSNGDIYFSNNFTSKMYRYKQSTKQIDLILSDVVFITGMAFDQYDQLYYGQSAVSGLHKILKINLNPDGTYLSQSTFAGDGSYGYYDVSGVPSLGVSLGSPSSLTFDAKFEYLYFMDKSFHIIRKIQMSTNTLFKVAGNGSVALFDIAEGAIAKDILISTGLGLAIGEDGTVFYVSENNKVKKILPDGKVYTVAGTGVGGYNGEGIATEKQINTQDGLYIMEDGSLLLCDSENFYIRIIKKDGTMSNYGGTGVQEVLGGDPNDLLNGEFQSLLSSNLKPIDIQKGPDGALYFTDTGKNRIRKIFVCQNPSKPEVTVTPAKFCKGETVTLSFEGDLKDAQQWSWYKDECKTGAILSNSTSISVTVNDNSEKYYVVGERGCVKDVACSEIKLEPSCSDYYNVITPNGDGLNDFFDFPAIENYPTNKVTFFNRWGDVIQEFENYNNSDVVWKGENSYSGKVPTGTYFFTAESDGKVITSGWIQVIQE